ncbi:hypothetical protein HanRHA438_Chr06g0271701 [Helianthus annuus]|nr:hypothetical protein HanRHA438_Chr06g0271701 [Helianthus annuus]
MIGCSDSAVIVITLSLSSFNFEPANTKLFVTELSRDLSSESPWKFSFVFLEGINWGSIGDPSVDGNRVIMAQSLKKLHKLLPSASLWDNDAATANPPHANWLTWTANGLAVSFSKL